MSDINASSHPGTGSPTTPLHVASDNILDRVLGHDLMSATLRGALYVLIAAAIFATIAAFVG